MLAGHPKREERQAVMGGRVRVLLADDHPIVREGICRLLERAPDLQLVGEVSNGADALRKARELAPDVLILDMEMPIMTGVEVAQRLRAEGASVRVLALSAHDDTQYILGVLESGAAGYLLKEEAPEAIVAAVRGVARGEEGWLSRRVVEKVMRRAKAEEPARCPLTQRELEVLRWVAKGLTGAGVAEKLGISERTIAYHVENLLRKLEVSNRTEAVVEAIGRGWLDL